MADDATGATDLVNQDNKTIYTDPDELKKVEAQISVFDGKEWLEISNTRSTNVINQKVDSVQAQVAEAQEGISTATTDAQNAVDAANDAITKAGFATDTANTAKQTVASVQDQVNNSAVGTNLLLDSSAEDLSSYSSAHARYWSTSPSGMTHSFVSIADSPIQAIDTVAQTVVASGTATGTGGLCFYSGGTPGMISGNTYTASMWIRTTSDSSNMGYAFQYGQNGSYQQLRGTVTSTDWIRVSYTFTFNQTSTSSGNDGKIYFLTYSNGSTQGTLQYCGFKLEVGTVATDWCLNPADNATVIALSAVNQTISGIQSVVANKADSSLVTQLSNLVDSKVNSSDYDSEITQLSSDINLRVKTGDLISQINEQAGGNTLIQVASGQGKLYLDASSVVFGGTAFIPSASIASISADKISAGTISGTNMGMDLSTGSLTTTQTSGSLVYTTNLSNGILELDELPASNSHSNGTATAQMMGGAYKITTDYGTGITYEMDLTASDLNFIQTDTSVSPSTSTSLFSLDAIGGVLTFSGSLVIGNEATGSITFYGNKGTDGMKMDMWGNLKGLSTSTGWYVADRNGNNIISVPMNGGDVGIFPQNGYLSIHNDVTTNSHKINGFVFSGNDMKIASGNDAYLDGAGGAGGNATLHVKSVTQTSLLSKKTNIEPLDTSEALRMILADNMYSYAFKDDLENGVDKRYTSFIIDDVNASAKYTEPQEFLSSDGKGRDDGTQLAYLIGAVQELYKQIQVLKKE